MWLFLIDGFYSVVQDKYDPDRLLVRCRDEFDAVRMAERLGVKAQHTPGPDYDYEWRMFVSRAQFSGLMEEAVQDIDYTNFKDKVHDVRGYSRAMIYGRVWALMLDALQRNPA